MAETGVLLRRNTKANLVDLPPVQGEMVFATDTGEHGWLNQSNTLVWKVLNEASPTIPADIVTAPAGVLPALDGSNLTNLPISEGKTYFSETGDDITIPWDFSKDIMMNFGVYFNIDAVVPWLESDQSWQYDNITPFRASFPISAGMQLSYVLTFYVPYVYIFMSPSVTFSDAVTVRVELRRVAGGLRIILRVLTDSGEFNMSQNGTLNIFEIEKIDCLYPIPTSSYSDYHLDEPS